jgi:hypothetical protein
MAEGCPITPPIAVPNELRSPSNVNRASGCVLILPKGAYSIENRNPADYRFWRFPAGALEAAARAVRNMYQKRFKSTPKRAERWLYLIHSVNDTRQNGATTPVFLSI